MGLGWIAGRSSDYDREYYVDLAQLSGFLNDTQPKSAGYMGIAQDSHKRRKFLTRLRREVSKRGTIDVLRHGIEHGPYHVDLFYGTPSPPEIGKQRNISNRIASA